MPGRGRPSFAPSMRQVGFVPHRGQAWVHEGFFFEDLMELGTLEEKALGRKAHGR